jgi:predicted dehydrogenase
MKQYNVGIVGYGWVSGAHIDAINATARAQVTAVCSSRPQDAAQLSAKHGGQITCYRRLEDLLADPAIHVISVCSLPELHADQIVAAAAAGKHLIIEKPISLTASDALRVARAVQAAGVKACVCFELRFASQLIATRSVLAQGLLGSIHYAEVDYYHGVGPWYGQYRWNTLAKSAGSSLLSAGCHALDALLLCVDSPVESVVSLTAQSASPLFTPYEYATTSATLVRFANGALGKVASVIDCLQPYYFHVHLVGSEGSLLDNKFSSRRIAGLDKSGWNQLAVKTVDSGDVSDHPYLAQFTAFFDALSRGAEMPLTSLSEALRTHEVVLAADRSAREGRTVKMSELHD